MASDKKIIDGPWDKAQPGPGVVSGGGGPHDGGMDPRITNLEERVSDLRVDIAVIKERLDHVATKTWVLGGVVVVLLAVLGAAWWMVQQYLGPILQGLGKH